MVLASRTYFDSVDRTSIRSTKLSPHGDRCHPRAGGTSNPSSSCWSNTSARFIRSTSARRTVRSACRSACPAKSASTCTAGASTSHRTKWMRSAVRLRSLGCTPASFRHPANAGPTQDSSCRAEHSSSDHDRHLTRPRPAARIRRRRNGTSEWVCETLIGDVLSGVRPRSRRSRCGHAVSSLWQRPTFHRDFSLDPPSDCIHPATHDRR